MKKSLVVGALSLASLAFSGAANAAACANGTSPMQTSDVTIHNNTTLILSSDCKFYEDANNTPNPPTYWGAVEQIGANMNANTGGSQVESISVGPNTGTITISPDPSPLVKAGSGNWDISWTGGAWLLDLIVVVKQGNDYGAYLFDNLALSPANSAYTNPGGTWTVNIPTQASTDGLSHLAFYYSDLRFTNGGGTPPLQVPEPAPVAMMGLALAGLAFARRQARSKQAK